MPESSGAESANEVKLVQEQLTDVEIARTQLKQRWDSLKNRDLFNLLMTTLPRILGAERCSVFILDPNRSEIWLEAGTGVVQRQICVAPESSMVGRAILNRQPVRAEGLKSKAGAHVEVGGQLHYEVDSALTVPVIDDKSGRAVGALQVLNKTGAARFSDADEELLKEIAFTIEPSILQLYDSQQILREAELMDREIAILRDREKALRPGHMFRTFEPLGRIESKGFLHTRYHEKNYPPFINPESTQHLKSTWDTDANDILICTHQKVGTHLAKKLLVELVIANASHREALPYGDGDIGHGAVPWPEVTISQEGESAWMAFMARTQLVPRLWYTHCAYEDLPCRRIHPKSKFVVVVREPKAAAVSQFYFWMRHPLLGVDPRLEIDAFADLFARGVLYFGGYHQHAAGWVHRIDNQIHDNQVCLLFYEDMVEKKTETIEKLQAFLYPGRSISPENVAAIAAASEFNAMKEDITSNPRSFHLNPQLYFRSGTTDDWKQKLTPHAMRVIDEATRRHWGNGLAARTMQRYLAAAG